jgi:competence protein ComFA
LHLPTDQYFWGQSGQEIKQVQVYSSIGQACRKQLDGRIWIGGGMGTIIRLEEEDIQIPAEWEDLSRGLWQVLEGRALLWEEVCFWTKQWWGSSVEEEKLRSLLQMMLLREQVRVLPGVRTTRVAWHWQCNRCGAAGNRLMSTPCARCTQFCLFCTHCTMLGKSRSCVPLFLFEPRQKEKVRRSVTMCLPVLTRAQQEAACQSVDFVRNGVSRFLLWAVTGSGKTEVLMPVVRRVLERGGRVLWAAPRRDVVDEIAARMERVFPEEKPLAIHGERSWEERKNRLGSPLVTATVQQAWRFYRRFDLVVVDEADAFPLAGDRTLQMGLERATMRGGTQCWVTATPSPRWKKEVYKGKLSLVSLPSRYHGYPLPIPRLLRVGRLWRRLERGKPVEPLSSFLHRVLETDGQALIFIPGTSDPPRLLKWIHHTAPDIAARTWAIATGKEKERRDRVEAFRKGEVQFLIATTVLERGVTVPRCHVVVVGADHPVFDTASLIQMAGRVGRSPVYQKGQVLFLADVHTEAQKTAVREIKELNHRARQRGFLVVDEEEQTVGK